MPFIKGRVPTSYLLATIAVQDLGFNWNSGSRERYIKYGIRD